MTVREVQLDGLVGPTHHFGGLSFGNLASMAHAGWRSRPRQAARQGLAKMRQVLALGLVQAVLPPLERPDLDFLRRLGFRGSDAEVLAKTAQEAPYLLNLATSSAFMWAANMATVIPSHDSEDGKCHVVMANLIATPHRALEAPRRTAMLRVLFPDTRYVEVHDPLPPSPALRDEGAANHSRLSSEPEAAGWHLFVYGATAAAPEASLPRRFPPRQSREASEAVARVGRLRPGHARFVRQHPRAIDAGAFHNDVVMVGSGNRLLLHECCLEEQAAVLAWCRQRLPELWVYEVPARELSLKQAVRSYLFNSQLLHTPQGWVLLAPAECQQGPAARVVQRLLDDGFVDRVLFQDLEQSMWGGGGPACLRLRLPLTQAELASMHSGVLLTEDKLQALEAWVDRYYREELTPHDLADPQLLEESRQALDALTQLLQLGCLYAFQREGV
ncbi:MAG: N-succinylarginine dihydrolase [Candidatus Tectimicrobiota bacterium]|nr:MAG: N-succinylarginine dihydrolase [Candidatus Tectomicrobia bacterium]